ncbi:ferredoxin--NADP reductase [Novosphingobium aerophilum]|uniref:ferredoxin--NADP reductase n=1 Tax=Novosphingobium TaxID=165696 RepID=UPI0010531B52|nr:MULTISPECIES: ferredoxin--NADP reductase [unclassified Novosphingobium]MPS67191.1 ferredoxin--NADP reductase [Novosphingobium sp.]TCM39784.1 ferredoxin--NADP+ reductase [Novosphingobium sp. ST904]WRT93992.1 ferredoxin--NADP reductase [Novosphingobium sp. RL4]
MSDGQAVMPTLEPTAALTVEEVLTVRHWNEHLFSFTMSRPASFRFRSGEFVMLGLQGEKRPLLRAYSIASPSWAEEIEFLSIKVPDGPLTSRLQLVQPGDQIYLGRKPTGTLVTDALLPGKRLFMLSTGTGLAPFMSLIRDPDVYDLYDEIVVVHCVRRVSDLAYREELESQLAEDPLVAEQALVQLSYVPTVTREPFHTTGRIGALVESGRLFEGLKGDARFNPETDRVMLCGSMDMIKDFSADLESWGFTEGSNAKPGDFVIERAFVG